MIKYIVLTYSTDDNVTHAYIMEKALDYALSYTIKDLVEQGRQVHPDTMEAYNFVKEKRLNGN